MRFSQADELARREHLGLTIAQGLRCNGKAGLTLLDATPILELRTEKNKYPEPIGH
jgi:hypothetical protein